MGEDISLNIQGIKNSFAKTIEFLKQKKVIGVITILILVAFLILGTSIRVQNLSLLKDSTTGEFIPQALDPFYFLRLSEIIIEQGGLPEIDTMRYPSAMKGFSKEILPQTTVFMFKFWKIFDDDVSLRYVNVISPVIFFILGLIVFFFLIYSLTNSKTTALLSSIFLSVITPYIHRTSAGFSDHESIGMFFFFLFLLFYSVSLKFLKKRQNKKLLKTSLWGIGLGFFSFLTIISWGGISKAVFMIVPISFLLIWLIRTQSSKELDRKSLSIFPLFYVVWFVSTILFGLTYGFNLSDIFQKVFLDRTSLINGVVLLFLLIDFSAISLRNKILIKEKFRKYRVLLSALLSFAIGSIVLFFMGTNIFVLIPELLGRIFEPLGVGRTGSTVAENAASYLTSWISQIGKPFFWLFYLGTVFLGFGLSTNIQKKKNKFLFSIAWIILISSIIFSRISSSSFFNGTNSASQLFYLGGLFLFFGIFAWIYFNDKIRMRNELILASIWLLLMLISARGAVRLFFVLVPTMCFMAGYSLTELFRYYGKIKDDLWKIIIFIVLILAISGAFISVLNFKESSTNEVKFAGPSANLQWQKAMSWVRDNTLEDSIFLHWWDYGYWVQYLGERTTITDGGHGVSFWDHLVGRYVLTTPFPETALSFMKSHKVSHLLIDPTDLGKYGAYSRIGSGPDGTDRFSQIPTMLLDSSQTRETADGEIRVYQGGVPIDEDIIYNDGNQDIFLPSGRAIAVGVLIDFSTNSNNVIINEAFTIFVYNNQQINIPLRYVYLNGALVDLGGGLDAIARIIPSASTSGQNIQIDSLGSVMYLSPRVSKSLFAQLYLMDDPFKNYSSVNLVHSEPDSFISSLRSQNTAIDDFIYFRGFRGPIKIWEVNHKDNILEKEEFLRIYGEFAEFDDLKFTT